MLTEYRTQESWAPVLDSQVFLIGKG